MMKIILGILLLMFLVGCGSTEYIRDTVEVNVRDTVFVVIPPAIENNLNAVVTDSVVTGMNIEGKDTVLLVKYFPREKKIYVKAKPDTVKFTYRDTITISTNTEIVKNISLWEKLGYALGGILLTGLILLIIKLKVV